MRGIPRRKFDRLIQFRRKVRVDDGISQVESFDNLGAPVWARKTDVSDGEKAAAGSASAHLIARFVVRNNAFTWGVTPNDAIQLDGLHYDITGRKEIGRQHELEFTATARIDPQ